MKYVIGVLASISVGLLLAGCSSAANDANTENNSSSGNATGVITGTLSYPGEGVPPLDVYVVEVGGHRQYSLHSEPSSEQWDLRDFTIKGIEPGTYNIFAYPDPAMGASPDLAGGYTQAVLCSDSASSIDCKDHSLVPVKVLPGNVVRNVDVVDWFASPDAIPPRPQDNAQAATAPLATAPPATFTAVPTARPYTTLQDKGLFGVKADLPGSNWTNRREKSTAESSSILLTTSDARLWFFIAVIETKTEALRPFAQQWAIEYQMPFNKLIEETFHGQKAARMEGTMRLDVNAVPVNYEYIEYFFMLGDQLYTVAAASVQTEWVWGGDKDVEAILADVELPAILPSTPTPFIAPTAVSNVPPRATPDLGDEYDQFVYDLEFRVWYEAFTKDFAYFGHYLETVLSDSSSMEKVFSALDTMDGPRSEVLSEERGEDAQLIEAPTSYKPADDELKTGCRSFTRASALLRTGLSYRVDEDLQSASTLFGEAASKMELADSMEDLITIGLGHEGR